VLEGAQARKRLQVARQAAQDLQLFDLEPQLAQLRRLVDRQVLAARHRDSPPIPSVAHPRRVGNTAPPHPPSRDQINQSTQESSSITRAGANGTNEAVVRVDDVVHEAVNEARAPRAGGIGGETRRRPVDRRRCGPADRGKIRVDARGHVARRRLSGGRIEADQDRLQLRNLRQTPVAAVGKATRREDRGEQAVQPSQAR